jgi:hypothetical protein
VPRSEHDLLAADEGPSRTGSVGARAAPSRNSAHGRATTRRARAAVTKNDGGRPNRSIPVGDRHSDRRSVEADGEAIHEERAEQRDLDERRDDG